MANASITVKLEGELAAVLKDLGTVIASLDRRVAALEARASLQTEDAR